MIVSKQDLDNFGLLSALPEKLKNLQSGDSFVFYYEVDEENVSLKVFEYETVTQISTNLYRGVQDKSKKYQAQINIGILKNTFDTKDGLFFQFLQTYNSKEAVSNFYNKIIEQDKVTDLNVSINAITEIINADGFRRAISYFSPYNMQTIMFIYDLVNQSFKSKLGKSLYGDSIKKVVNMIKFEGGVLPEWDKSLLRYMIIGPNADLTPDQRERYYAAVSLVRSGHPIDKVYSQTGWALGDKDGKWRTNIADNEARISLNKMVEFAGKRMYVPDNTTPQEILPLTLNPAMLYSKRYPGKLYEVLEHPTLYSYYPWLATLPIVYFYQDKAIQTDLDTTKRNSKPQDFYFAPNERGGYILINGSFLAGDSLSILLHEIQHSIQHREGYATGGNMFLAKFVSAVGSESVRSIFAAINKMQHYFKDNCLSDSTRLELQSLLKKIYLHSSLSENLRENILQMIVDQKTYEESYTSINFYLAILISEENDFTSPLFEFMQEKIGDFVYDIFSVISEGYANAKNYENILINEGFSKGYVTQSGEYKRGDIDNILFKGYENLYGEVESRSVQASRYVGSEYKNYFHLTHWELGPLTNLTVIDGVEEVVDCTKIVGACESVGDNYVLHFEKNADIKPFIHELGHIVFDALKTLGYEGKIISEFKNQYDFTNVDEYFVEKWMGYIKNKVQDAKLQEDMRLVLNASNPVISEILDEFFKDTDVDSKIKFLNKMLSLIDGE